MKYLFATILAALVAVPLGCGDEEACTSDSDCFAGEVCQAGACGAPSQNNSTSQNNATSANNTSANATTANNSTSSSNATTGSNSTTGNNATSNNATSNNATTGNNGGTDVCIADPFDVSCPDDGNDSFADTIVNDTKGCLPDDSTFKVMDETVSGLLCALEERDRYSQLYAECRSKSFVTEVLLKPAADCAPEDIIFDVGMQGKSCENQADSADITCDVTPEGWLRARIIVRPSGVPSIGSLRIDVEPARPNVHFEYDLQVSMRE